MEWQIYHRETGAVLGDIEASSSGAAVLGAMLQGHDGGTIGVRAVTAELRELADLRAKLTELRTAAQPWLGLAPERRQRIVDVLQADARSTLSFARLNGNIPNVAEEAAESVEESEAACRALDAIGRLA